MEVEGRQCSGEENRRSICPSCDRPQRVCLCHVIPSTPIPTKTHIIIIQHPHESRHKLNTVPLLTKSLQNDTVYTTRRITPSTLPSSLTPHSTYYLFPPSPSSPAISLSNLPHTPEHRSPLVLNVLDATWKHAKEMVKASEGYLGKRVCLDGYNGEIEGGSIYDSELIVRKEPCGGCVTTFEAVARWVAAVEDNGPEVEAQLLAVLKEMVRLQAQFLKPMKPRPKLVKTQRD